MTLVQPSPELQIQIRKHLNEDINTRDSDLQAIKLWLKQQPHLPDTWDDARLMSFLRGCSFSLEKTKQKLDNYFSMRGQLPEFFANRDVNQPELKELIKIGEQAPLPNLTPDGKRVTILRTVVDDFDTPQIADLLKLTLMYVDVRMGYEKNGILGDVYIFDCKVANVKHFSMLAPNTMKKFMACVTDAYPVKLKEVHLINITPFVDFILNWIKPFLKDKIRKRIFFHKGVEGLFDYVPREIIPEEYGGYGGKMKDFNQQWAKILEEHKDWFKAQESVKADESKRPGQPKNYDNLWGSEGSFRKLNLD